MKILFWGTPAYAVPSLDALVAAGHELVGVVSQPDRRRGRGKALVPSAVKARALELELPVFTPERIRREAPLQAPDPVTFYSPGPAGYTDYPTLEPQP